MLRRGEDEEVPNDKFSVGSSENMANDGTEKGPRQQKAGIVGDDISEAMRPEVKGPQSSGLGKTRGEAARDDQKEMDQGIEEG